MRRQYPGINVDNILYNSVKINRSKAGHKAGSLVTYIRAKEIWFESQW